MERVEFGALGERFDGFLIDQFGVLIDGAAAYEGAPEALAQLKREGKRVLVLSNSGKRSAPNEARLERLGFSRDTFERVLSSGEVAHRILEAEIGETLPARPRIFLLARDGDTSAIDGLGAELTQTPADADLILITGSEGELHPLDHYHDLLAEAARNNTRCINTNPDMAMLTAKGPAFGAGRIASLYEELGGEVTRIGKPYPAIYDAAREILASTDRIVAIGDSPAHDILGGRNAGFATALTRTGIHADVPDDQLEELCAQEGAIPDFIIPLVAA